MAGRLYSVVDFNSGMGGCSLGFLEAGFLISAAFENGRSERALYQSMLPNVPVIEREPLSVDFQAVPEADVFLSRLYVTSMTGSLKYGKYKEETRVLAELILRKRPKVFLVYGPARGMKSAMAEDLCRELSECYRITYQICRGAWYSGFPVNSRQSFFVGVRDDIADVFFEFPRGDYEEPVFPPQLEEPETLDPWYRRLSPALALPADKFPYFYRNFGRELIGSKEITLNRGADSYVADPMGLRRLTHREIGWLKGFGCRCDFNSWPNRYSMYQMLQNAPDIHIVRSLAKSIRKFLDSLDRSSPEGGKADGGDDAARVEQGAPAGEAASKPERAGKKPELKKEAVPITPRSRIVGLRIDHLKGLDNLEISFEKRLTAIMGVNGVGKSTILHALACMFSPAAQGEDHQFNQFFTPTPDASWQGSRFQLTYFDETEQKLITRAYQKTTDRWSPKYDSRPKRDVFFLGIETGIPEIERESHSAFIDYQTAELRDRLSAKVRDAAAQILNKDYEYLTKHKTQNKELFGIHTQSNITYSSLSMGAGEQRLIRILTVAYGVPAYSLILIDEMDLLLHSEAQKKLVKALSQIAEKRKLQMIFTTHSLEIGSLTEFVDVRYLFRMKDKVAVYDRITPYIVSELQEVRSQLLTVYVEDDLAQTIVLHVAEELGLNRCVRVRNIGSATNAFTVAAGIVLMGESLEDVLIVQDGDVYRTAQERRTQIQRMLTGTEVNHEEKIDAAVSAIVPLNLPENVKPEKYIHDMLLQADGDEELTDCARAIQAVSEDHEWLNHIIEQMNISRAVALYRMVGLASKSEEWDGYVAPVREWLVKKQEEHQLYSFSRKKAAV